MVAASLVSCSQIDPVRRSVVIQLHNVPMLQQVRRTLDIMRMRAFTSSSSTRHKGTKTAGVECVLRSPELALSACSWLMRCLQTF